MDEDEEPRRPKKAPRMRLSAEQRDTFLEVLGQTGNRRAAAMAIGVEPRLMDQRREFDAVLDRQWEEALEQAHRRLSGASGPFDCVGGREFNVIKRGKDGRLQIVAAGQKRWTRKVEERFFAALAMCGNIAAAARAVGFTSSSVCQRRRQWPDFARRLDEALEDAELRIEFRVASMGSDLDAAGLDEAGASRPSTASVRSGQASLGTNGSGAEPQPMPAEVLRFDPDLALRFLKWREEKRRGRGRRGRVPAPPSIEEVTERLIRRVEAIKRHRERGEGGA